MGNRGITLIVLVVTIVIIIILGGISISLLTGENGVINRTIEAKENMRTGQKEEKINLKRIEEIMNDNVEGKTIEQVNDKNPGILEEGSEDGTYIINSIEDLVCFSYNVKNGNTYEGKTIKLGIDLDFKSTKSYVDAFRTDYGKYGYDENLLEELTSNKGWEPIGDVANIEQNNFKGIFDGNNKVIYNLYIGKKDIKDVVYIGMFANNQGTIKNLELKNIKVDTSGGDEVYYFVAGISGNNQGTITNCITDGIYQSEGNYALISGITGRNQGIIEQCTNKANISGEAMYMAGICAQNLAQIKKCNNGGEINSIKSGSYIGGITGLSNFSNSSIIESFNTANIVATIDNIYYGHIGGIVGQTQSNIEWCYNVGDILVSIESTEIACNIGGIAGTLVNILQNCYSKGTIRIKSINGDVSVGGIIGKFNQGKLKNVYSEKIIEFDGKASVGGESV